MDLKEIMDKKNFVVLGDTLNEEKYACKIKNKLKEYHYNVSCVGKELDSINDVVEEIEVLDLCIHPAKGIQLLKECTKTIPCVLIQPGAQSEEIFEYLKENNIPYLEGCALKGIERYRS